MAEFSASRTAICASAPQTHIRDWPRVFPSAVQLCDIQTELHGGNKACEIRTGAETRGVPEMPRRGTRCCATTDSNNAQSGKFSRSQAE